MQNFLDFEKPLLDIQSKMEELRHLKDNSENIANELSNLQEKFDKKLSEIKEKKVMTLFRDGVFFNTFIYGSLGVICENITTEMGFCFEN